MRLCSVGCLSLKVLNTILMAFLDEKVDISNGNYYFCWQL